MILLLALVLAQSSGETCYRVPRAGHGCDYRTGRSGPSLPFFSAFPAGGAGTFGTCSVTPPTGAKGEVFSYPGTGAKTCTKTASGGFATTGIANGDLVSLTSLPRVEYDTNGVLGYLEEVPGTNLTLRSEEFENVYWTNDVAPTVNYAVGPFGTTTAERYQFAATSGVQRSVGFVSGGCPIALAATQSLYVRGVSSSGTMDLCQGDLGAGSCTACAFVSGSWSRCTWTKTAVGPGYFVFGNASIWNGSIARAANDVIVLGAQCEAGSYATSYIPTTTAAVTRTTELGAGWTLSPGVGPSGCIAVSATFPSTATGNTDMVSLGTAGAGNNWSLYRRGDTTAGYQIGATVSEPVVASMGLTTHRWLMTDNAGTRTAFFDGVSKAAPAASMSGAQTALAFNNIAGLGQGSTIYTRLEVDLSSSRCTP